MRKLLIFTIISFFSQLIDGALGMAYGISSASMLLMLGMAPVVASTSIHLAEIAITASSGLAHLRFGNIDAGAVRGLIIPGALGAFLGAAFLSAIPGNLIKPYISLFLLLLGIYIMIRFLRLDQPKQESCAFNASPSFLAPLGFIGGLMDAIGGGGWGPIVTPVLLAKQAASPRKVIGSVDASEFAVSLSASLGFLIFLGWSQVNWLWVGAFIIGGVIAAPIAAWLINVIPAYLLGVLVGGLIILTNLRTLLHSVVQVPEYMMITIYLVVAVVWVAVIVWQIVKNRR